MIKKKVHKTSVRVIFELPADVAEDGVSVVGDFNNWSPDEGQMDYIKTRDVWKKGVSFEPGETHEFRYVLDGSTYENDEDADGYAPNPYAGENSVLEL